jgi:ubiquinone/menaquinone biosynthesis C-methylase UbiE
MTLETYYKDHWVEIEPERLDRYEEMFQWSPAFDRALEPAGIEAGHAVADFGCGPGYLAMELLRRVGAGGHVHALDVNADFIDRTRARAEAEGLAGNLSLHHLAGGHVPLADDALDRMVAKNVMVYVDDPLATLGEFRRVLRPGGKAHIIDSDFAMVAVDPVPPADWRALMDAALHAFRTPNIGRKLYGLAAEAGFSDVQVQVLASPDTEGRLLNFVHNVAGYAREGGGLDDKAIRAVVDTATEALAAGKFFAINPQFVVTATV